MRWNLDELYTGFDSAEFKADVQKLDELIADLDAYAKANLQGDPGEALKGAVSRIERFYVLFQKAIGYASLRQAVEAENPDANAWLERLSSKQTGAVEALVRFRKYLGELGGKLEEVIAADPALAEFTFFLKENREFAKYMLSDEVEKAISLMEITGSKAWSNLHNTLTSTVMAEMAEGGEVRQLTLPMVRNLAYDPDPDVRRRAYEAELAAYPKIDKSAAACLNGIKGEVLTKCRLRGHKSPLDAVLFESRMDRQTLDAMIGTMEEYLPVFRRYMKAKAKLLGRKNGLPFYDLFAPVGGAERKYTLEEARQYLVNAFSAINPDMAAFIDNAFEGEWLDTEPRPGKQGGAFCSSTYAISQSRILSNFDGSFNGVTTLAHELGHAWHSHCMIGQSMLNCDYPMQLAETASIFFETLIMNKAIGEAAGDGEKLALLETQLSDSNQVVVDILSRYYFEASVFEGREDRILSAEDMKGLMADAQKRAYGDGLDPDLLHPWMWVCKGHYYMGIDFYNFPYAFGLLFGLGVYGLYEKQGAAFLPQYKALLASTGSADIASVCASVGIDVRDRAFWRGSLEVIRANVERFEALAGK